MHVPNANQAYTFLGNPNDWLGGEGFSEIDTYNPVPIITNHYYPIILPVGKNPENIGKRRLAIFSREYKNQSNIEPKNVSAYYDNFVFSEQSSSMNDDIESTPANTCHSFKKMRTYHHSNHILNPPSLSGKAEIVEDGCGILISESRAVHDLSTEYTVYPVYPDTLLSFYFQTDATGMRETFL